MLLTLTQITILLVLFASTLAAPQAPTGTEAVPTPYNFQYKVENPPTNTFFGQNEAGDEQGRVTGSYYVLLPDGRQMTVEYSVNGESGFVPRISYQNDAKPTKR